MSSSTIAVVGATGAVGTEMMSVLEARGVAAERVRLMASARSAGRTVSTAWGAVEIEDLEAADPQGIDVALFSAGGERSRSHAPRFVAAGATVIDNSSAFRMDPAVPLVVAGVNDHALERHRGLIANPNCTTMVLMMAAAPLHRVAGLRRLHATSYQSVSGTGRAAMAALVHELDVLGKDTDRLVRGGWTDPVSGVYQRPIGFNVVPLAGSITEEHHTDEEWKLVRETRKILERDDISVEPACVRVPVMVGHGIAATLFFDRRMDRDEALELLAVGEGIEVWGDDRVPTPLDSAGTDAVLVGRVRATLGEPGGISLWAVGDNLRKGAALNAVQLAELVLG